MTLINSQSLRGRCPVCGEAHAACGPPSESVPFDARMEVAAVSGPLKVYEVELPGGRKATMQLNEEDAKRYGVTENGSGGEQATQETPGEESATKSRTTRNKARTASDKGDG